MSKVTKYLNEHILGEAIDNPSLKNSFYSDGSILGMNPDIIINPRTTNDIRKINRFAWQLAEKGHSLPITTRGGGTDQTGAAIGKGIIINTKAHLDKIIFISSKDKDKFVHTQPGLNFETLQQTLKQQGLFIPSCPTSSKYCTIGGAIANNAGGGLVLDNSRLSDYITRLEIILANGDVLETGRISRHELNKKKGLQTLEGEIYRQIDGLVEDNKDLIEEINDKDNVGYSGIKKVKQKNGSFDLTPLFIGSQGTLGIISEIIANVTFYNNNQSIIVIPFKDKAQALAFIPAITKLKPVVLDYIDGGLIEITHKQGKKFIFDKPDEKVSPEAILYVSFGDFSQKSRQHKVKSIRKQLYKQNIDCLVNDSFADEELIAIRQATANNLISANKAESTPYLIDGASIPTEKIPEFLISLQALTDKHHTSLPPIVNCLNGVIKARSQLQMQSVSDKQKSLKLINDYADLIYKFGGCLCYESAEGRLKSLVAYSKMDPKLKKLYQNIKKTFDPFNILNPGVKDEIDIKSLISNLNPDYNLARYIDNGPRF